MTLDPNGEGQPPKQECYTDVSGCYICGSVAPVSGIPASHSYVPMVGWNAGANSAHALGGDVRLYFGLPAPPVDAVIGLKRSVDRYRAAQAPQLILFGWRFLSAAGLHLATIWEGGVEPIGRTALDAASDTFEVLRQGNAIIYKRNGAEVHRRPAGDGTPLIVTGCIFYSGDALPSCAP